MQADLGHWSSHYGIIMFCYDLTLLNNFILLVPNNYIFSWPPSFSYELIAKWQKAITTNTCILISVSESTVTCIYIYIYIRGLIKKYAEKCSFDRMQLNLTFHLDSKLGAQWYFLLLGNGKTFDFLNFHVNRQTGLFFYALVRKIWAIIFSELFRDFSPYSSLNNRMRFSK